MTKQEAYVELNLKLKAINEAVVSAKKFARENSLLMGQKRYSVGTFESAQPHAGKTESDEEAEWDESGSIHDDWISSQVCW